MTPQVRKYVIWLHFFVSLCGFEESGFQVQDGEAVAEGVGNGRGRE